MTLDVVGLGNAIVDVIARTEDDFLVAHGMRKGTMALIDEAIDRVMNPARNPYRVDMLDVAYHSPMMRTLHHANYVFEKKLSHTADSQDQRHRMVPASRPMMTLADTTQPDYITPRLIRQNAAALAVYEQAMADAWAANSTAAP